MLIDSKKFLACAWLIVVMVTALSLDVAAQRKTKKKPVAAPVNELAKLREEFIKATNAYKTSLTKLIAIHEGDVTKAEKRLEESRKLLEEGLIARTQVEENERALAAAKDKVAEARRQITSADEQ